MLSLWTASLAAVACLGMAAATGSSMRLALRTRVEAFKGSGEWQAVDVESSVSPAHAALIICDLWDKHWCLGATGRVDAIAHKASPVIDLARRHGILIIHAPSDTMSYYQADPARMRVFELPKTEPPRALTINEPPLPIDDSDGGCDTPDNPMKVNTKAWSREHPAIRVAPVDLVSDDGGEVYSALRLRGIDTLFVMGVHTNMCILNRSFAIRQMTKWGIRCILIRDLTDSMYNPARRPYVTHDEGTRLVIEHIEKYWAPTITSDQLAQALEVSGS